MPDEPRASPTTANLLTTEEVAQQLCLSPDTLQAWRHRGPNVLPFVKLGKLVRYRQGDVNAFVEGRLCSA